MIKEKQLFANCATKNGRTIPVQNESIVAIVLTIDGHSSGESTRIKNEKESKSQSLESV